MRHCQVYRGLGTAGYLSWTTMVWLSAGGCVATHGCGVLHQAAGIGTGSSRHTGTNLGGNLVGISIRGRQFRLVPGAERPSELGPSSLPRHLGGERNVAEDGSRVGPGEAHTLLSVPQSRQIPLEGIQPTRRRQRNNLFLPFQASEESCPPRGGCGASTGRAFHILT